jgi:hypothetical protein
MLGLSLLLTLCPHAINLGVDGVDCFKHKRGLIKQICLTVG